MIPIIKHRIKPFNIRLIPHHNHDLRVKLSTTTCLSRTALLKITAFLCDHREKMTATQTLNFLFIPAHFFIPFFLSQNF